MTLGEESHYCNTGFTEHLPKPEKQEVFMCVALIGGMDRLERQYINIAKQLGIKLRVFSQHKNSMQSKIGKVDGVVIFTNKVSHKARKEAVRIAKINKIPFLMHHSCGVCSLRECLTCLKKAQCPLGA